MREHSAEISFRELAAGAEAPPTTQSDTIHRARALRRHAMAGQDLTVSVGATRLPVLGTARLYVCGITPYDTTHLGHAATFAWADLAARVFRLTGAEVELCRNVTDVDEHLLGHARSLHLDWRGVAAEQTYRFEREMAELGLVVPTYEPRSFDHVDEVVALAQELLQSDHAYLRHSTVYFRGAEACQAAGLSEARAMELARSRDDDPDDPDKEHPLDAVVWRRSADGEPGWDSPFGRGRPGWHAECSAMALGTYGPTLDLHIAGADLAFPHNTYEAAQAEAFSGVHPFARAWLHVGTVMIAGHKMSKAAGNLVFVRGLLDRYGPAALRLALLDRPWAEPWEFDEQVLARAPGRVEELWQRAGAKAPSEAAGPDVLRALVENLDVPTALSVATEAGGHVLRDLMWFLGITG